MENARLRLAALVAVLFALSALAVGCGGSTTDTTAGGDSSSDLATIEPGYLTVGSDIPYAPIEFGDPPGYEGFDIDIVNAIADKLGLEPKIQKTPFDTITRDVSQHRFDMLASAMTITPDREKEVSFSEPYFAADQALAVAENGDVESSDDVGPDTIVGAQLATTGEQWARDNFPDSEIRTYDLVDDALGAVANGQIDAAVIDYPVVYYAQEQGEGIRVADTIDTDEYYGLAFAKDTPELLDAVNKALAEIKADGTYTEIYDKWFSQDPPAELVEDSGATKAEK